MIHITGDTHGEQARIPLIEAQAPVRPGDILIVCGDFGYLFRNDEAEHRFLDQLAARDYTICFVDGNHENFPAIYAYPVIEWHGGKAHQLRKNIFHLMRGEVYEIEGKSFFAFGGAYSIDKSMRTEGVSWWPAEQPNDQEYKNASENLKKYHYKVDHILTHTLPREMILRYGKHPDPHDLQLTGFLEWVTYETKFEHWWYGHWHDDQGLTEKFTIL